MRGGRGGQPENKDKKAELISTEETEKEREHHVVGGGADLRQELVDASELWAQFRMVLEIKKKGGGLDTGQSHWGAGRLRWEETFNVAMTCGWRLP